MITSSFFRKRAICRCAGDPVDVVDGANFFETLDVRLVGPLPLVCKRAYNTACVGQPLPLSWGHSHGFDHTLHFNLDGIRYTNPLQDILVFPALDSDGETSAVDGLLLERLSPLRFALHESGEPSLEFTFEDDLSP